MSTKRDLKDLVAAYDATAGVHGLMGTGDVAALTGYTGLALIDDDMHSTCWTATA